MLNSGENQASPFLFTPIVIQLKQCLFHLPQISLVFQFNILCQFAPTCIYYFVICLSIHCDDIYSRTQNHCVSITCYSNAFITAVYFIIHNNMYVFRNTCNICHRKKSVKISATRMTVSETSTSLKKKSCKKVFLINLIFKKKKVWFAFHYSLAVAFRQRTKFQWSWIS